MNGLPEGTAGSCLLDDELLGFRPSLVSLRRLLLEKETSDEPLLIAGKSGTGKTHLARLIHDLSPRSQAPFVSINCEAALPFRFEIELFGLADETNGAIRPLRPGKLEAAANGTMLFDGIEALDAYQLRMLFHLINSDDLGSRSRLGLPNESVRYVFTINKELDELPEIQQVLREFLSRANITSISLPALNENKDDIVPLARQLALRYARQFGKDLSRLHPEVEMALERYSWPGNIRELENVMQNAVRRCRGSEILLSDLPLRIIQQPIQYYFSDVYSMNVPDRPGNHHDQNQEYQSEVLVF